jgi:hypothetical protein
VKTAADIDYTTIAGAVVIQTFVHSITVSGKLPVSASEPPLRVAQNRFKGRYFIHKKAMVFLPVDNSARLQFYFLILLSFFVAISLHDY